MIKRTHFGSPAFYKSALAIAIPVMLQALLQNVVSLIDNFMVAGLGDVKMSGVNVTNQLLFIFFVSMNTISVAGGIFMSQYNGAKDSDGMQQSFRFKFHVSMILAIVVGLACAFFPKQLLGLLVNRNTQSAEIVEAGSEYLALIIFTLIPIGISTSIATSFRETGNVKPPLVISVAATLVNTFFNWVFIYGNLGAPRLEVRGAAIATIIARIVEMVIYIVYIRKTRPLFYSRIRDLFKIKIKLFLTILRKSGLLFASELSWVIIETIMTAVYNGRGGAEIVSGMAAGWAIANLFMLIFGGIHTAIGVIVGGTLGKNEIDAARDQARWLKNGAFILGCFIALIESFSVLLVPLVFGNLSADSRIVTRNLLWIISAYMPVWTYLNAQFAIARAGGDAIMGAWVDVSVNTVLFLPGIFLLAWFTDFGPVAMYAIVKITDFVKVGVAAWQLSKERWLKNLTLMGKGDEVIM
ncbi:MATE family efflux transporter [Brucepastera parasyntrophica]|uniref:MATE family efflux transporter n=1 Tax=Brucepastera parasyntrophica TaxID=2880008 RepID=UPI0021089659|nr:MATE family efflux transporter [Brucepastera parasyntrophica]ULQ58758.1 MATE family efflux transporter [Brucepastera parasyntrophica]